MAYARRTSDHWEQSVSRRLIEDGIVSSFDE